MASAQISKRILQTTSICFVVACKRSVCQQSSPTSDPLNCHIPACADMSSMFKKSVKGIGSSQPQSSDQTENSSSTNRNTLQPYVGCPADKNALGLSSWVLLHTMAANYPDQPTKEQQQQMTEFIEALSIFYPCKICATDFQTSIRASPPRVASRQELVLWMCEQHNEVNEKLGLPLFPCDLAALDERWRHSQRKECWPQQAQQINNAESTSKKISI